MGGGAFCSPLLITSPHTGAQRRTVLLIALLCKFFAGFKCRGAKVVKRKARYTYQALWPLLHNFKRGLAAFPRAPPHAPAPVWVVELSTHTGPPCRPFAAASLHRGFSLPISRGLRHYENQPPTTLPFRACIESRQHWRIGKAPVFFLLNPGDLCESNVLASILPQIASKVQGRPHSCKHQAMSKYKQYISVRSISLLVNPFKL